MDVSFQVRVKTSPEECVCVVGDIPELGNWQPQRALCLERTVTDKNGPDNDSGELWQMRSHFPSRKDFKYRYFVCYITSEYSDGKKEVVVSRWETNIKPRTYSSTRGAVDEVAEFGVYDGKSGVDQGWLINQTEIQLRLHSSPLEFWQRTPLVEKPYRIQCKMVDLRYSEGPSDFRDEIEEEGTPFHKKEQNRVSVAVLKDNFAEPHDQNVDGEIYCPGDYMIFKAQTMEPQYIGFQLDFYTHSSNLKDQPVYLGYTYVLPVNLRDTSGLKSLPITGPRHRPVGQVTVDYLIITPLKTYQCDMQTSYANHWKQRRPLDVGHRGMGNSYKQEKAANVRENTIASLTGAANHGAEFIEFDVQLSKDLYPVIYHDFKICLTLRKKAKDDFELFEVPVKDLNLDQLQKLKTDHHTLLHNESKGLPAVEDEHAENQHFPTLCEVFEAVDPHTGFNIEVKYPQPFQDGTHEMDPFFERNEYIDIILTETLKHAGDRRIIFSCFDPDICAMLRVKQNRYPTCYLSKGQRTGRSDCRCRTLAMALNVAHFANLLGVNLYSEELLENLEYVKVVKEAHLVLFVWGEINDTETVNLLRSQGVDGLIYDRIYELKGHKENIFKMERCAKAQELSSDQSLSEDMGNVAS